MDLSLVNRYSVRVDTNKQVLGKRSSDESKRIGKWQRKWLHYTISESFSQTTANLNANHDAWQTIVVQPCLPTRYTGENRTRGNGGRWSSQRKTTEVMEGYQRRQVSGQASHCSFCCASQMTKANRGHHCTGVCMLEHRQRR